MTTQRVSEAAARVVRAYSEAAVIRSHRGPPSKALLAEIAERLLADGHSVAELERHAARLARVGGDPSALDSYVAREEQRVRPWWNGREE